MRMNTIDWWMIDGAVGLIVSGLSAKLPEGTSATAHEILGLIAKSI